MIRIRNCVELGLKAIWFEETGESFRNRCKVLLDRKHCIEGMWKNIEPFVLEYAENEDDKEHPCIVGKYCIQIHRIDTDARKFRYPVTKKME